MTWSDQDLDALRDGALDSACARALNAALLEDSALRSRWASLARSDARASAIFAGSTPMRRPATSRVTLMAVLALAGVVAVSIRVNPSRPAAPLTGVEERTAAREVLAGGPRLRVLAEYAAPARVHPHVQAQRHEVVTSTAVDFRSLGEALRSATEARELLAKLPVEQQLDACEVWAADPRLRPAAFEHLRALRASGTAGASEVADSLSRRRELRGWLASYGLTPPAPAPVRLQ